MSVYRKYILPRLCDLSMRNKRLEPYRRRVIGAAEGRVLEIGAGSGLNFGLYGPNAHELLALEPDPKLLRMARTKAVARAMPLVTFLEASAEDIPLEDRSVDTIVTTWTMCAIPDVHRALEEVRRVLKPGGQLLFVEHGLAPDPGVEQWQHRLDPLWRRVSGGCHLNRPIKTLIEDTGFRIDALQCGYMPGPKVMTFLYEGSAHPR